MIYMDSIGVITSSKALQSKFLLVLIFIIFLKVLKNFFFELDIVRFFSTTFM